VLVLYGLRKKEITFTGQPWKHFFCAKRFFLSSKISKKSARIHSFSLLPTSQDSFFAYMVVDRNTAGLQTNQLSSTLIARVKKMLLKDKILRNCETLLFEVEDPRKSPRAKQLEDIARIQRFCSLAESQNFSLMSYEINYIQPSLSLPNEEVSSNEQPLLLLFAKAYKGPRANREIRQEIIEVLSFIYLYLYPEGFSPIEEEQTAYQAYCKRIHERVISRIPEIIEMINPAHLTCGRQIRKASKAISKQTN
jgi:hypothetical protein